MSIRPSADRPAEVVGRTTGGPEADAVVARAYAFLAAALAADGAPPREALAAELAAILDVQAFGVLQSVERGIEPVIQFGFPGAVLDAVGDPAVDAAMRDGMPVAPNVGRDAALRSVLVVPATLGGRPWGVVVVGSALADAIGDDVRRRVEALASGIAVVLGPLATSVSRAFARERRLRQGLESLVELVADIVEEASPKEAAQSLAESMVDHFGWERVLLVAERPDLGILPIAVAGQGIRAADVVRPDHLVVLVDEHGERTAGSGGKPFFAGSRSTMSTSLPLGEYAQRGMLVVESEGANAFDDVDLQIVQGVATLAGPLLGRLWRRGGVRNLATTDDGSEVQRRRFISLAHELRTPVTVMIGYADLLASPGPDSEQRQAYGATLARHARALGRMVDNALVTWQLDDGALEITKRPMDVHAAVLEAVDALGVDIAVDRVERVDVVADVFWLPRVVQSLLDNARRYVPEGEVQVSTSLRDEVVRLAVHDDGPGIPAEDLEHIFDPFHRGRDGGTGPHRGVGLGLTVARQLMRAMGGDIGVASAPDYGTTFTVTIPRV